MRLWPFGQVEQRASATDAVVSALLAGASGSGIAPHAEALASVEIAAGLWGRAFASSTVTPLTPATRALTPHVLRDMGRALALRGQGVWVIDFDDGFTLTQAATWEVRGGPRPESWRYLVELPLPGGGAVKRNLPAEAVIHPRYATRPSAPWQGVSPLGLASETSALAGWLETRLKEESSTATAYILALPENKGSIDGLKTDLKSGKGRLHIVDTTAGGWGDGQAAAPRKDWETTRLGASPPAALATLRGDVKEDVLGVFGIPASLHSSAAASREAYRQTLQSTLVPLAALVAEELAAKLDAPGLALSFEELRAADIASRARAYKALVEAGMSPTEAAAKTGLD